MSNEKKSPEEETPPLQWEYKEELPIQVKMKEMLEMTAKATELQIKVLRKKLTKLQYGS